MSADTAADSGDFDELTFAVAAFGVEGGWELHELPAESLDSLDDLVGALRRQRAEGAVVGMVCLDDDWCALLRLVPGGVRILMSDATAALDYDLAADMLDELDIDVPAEEEAEESDEAWPEGDFELLEDLDASEQFLSVIFDDEDLYASEQILRVAEELGFGEDLADLLDLDY